MGTPDFTRFRVSRPQLAGELVDQVRKTAKLYLGMGILVALAMVTFGCIHKAGGGQVTPFEKAVTYSDMLAQTNNSIAKGVIEAQQQGLITVDQAKTMLTAQSKIAIDHEALTKLLQLGQSGATAQATQIKASLDAIRAQVNSLTFENAGLGIKNPTSQQTFANDVNSIFSFTDVILASLQTAGVLQ